jgi:hypothetical protein
MWNMYERVCVLWFLSFGRQRQCYALASHRVEPLSLISCHVSYSCLNLPLRPSEYATQLITSQNLEAALRPNSTDC